MVSTPQGSIHGQSAEARLGRSRKPDQDWDGTGGMDARRCIGRRVQSWSWQRPEAKRILPATGNYLCCGLLFGLGCLSWVDLAQGCKSLLGQSHSTGLALWRVPSVLTSCVFRLWWETETAWCGNHLEVVWKAAFQESYTMPEESFPYHTCSIPPQVCAIKSAAAQPFQLPQLHPFMLNAGPKLPLSHSSGEVHFPPSPTAAIGGNFNSNIARLSSQTSQRKRIPSLDNLQTLR